MSNPLERGYCAIGLYMPKTEMNVGGAMRAAYCYGAAMIAVQGKRFRKMSTDPQASWRHVPLLQVDNLRDALPFDCQPVCVELAEDAESLVTFQHPQRAFYIFGPEDGSVPKELTGRYRTVVVPTNFCMNLAATVNVVLYDRRAKQLLGRDRVAKVSAFEAEDVGSIPTAPATA